MCRFRTILPHFSPETLDMLRRHLHLAIAVEPVRCRKGCMIVRTQNHAGRVSIRIPLGTGDAVENTNGSVSCHAHSKNLHPSGGIDLRGSGSVRTQPTGVDGQASLVPIGCCQYTHDLDCQLWTAGFAAN